MEIKNFGRVSMARLWVVMMMVVGGGWLDTSNSLYYFDSSRFFPEDSLDAAIRFGIENGQIAVFVLSQGSEIRLNTPGTFSKKRIAHVKSKKYM